MPAALGDSALPEPVGLEGHFLDMYLDSGANATVGLGHRIPSPEEAKKLPFVKRGSSERPDDNQIVNAYQRGRAHSGPEDGGGGVGPARDGGLA